MKKIIILGFCAALSFIFIAFPSAAYGSPSQEGGGGTMFKDVAGKDWMLSELRSGGKTVTIDRNKLEADSMGGYFALNFKGDNTANQGQVSGVAAPNRYFGPYTAADNGILNIANMATTMMMAFKVPEGLNEKEYLDYLTKATRWDLRDGKLELKSSSSDNLATVLVFVSK